MQVSDIYVRLGNGFEVCVTAFKQAGISTKCARPLLVYADFVASLMRSPKSCEFA